MGLKIEIVNNTSEKSPKTHIKIKTVLHDAAALG